MQATGTILTTIVGDHTRIITVKFAQNIQSSFNGENTVKSVLSSHTREAQKVAAKGRWLLNRGEYQCFNIWEQFVCLLKTGCCLIEVTANTGLTVCK